MEIAKEKLLDAYFEKPKRTTTWSSFEVKEIYTPKDIEHIDYEKDLANAGSYPFTRGIYPDMYRGRLWTRRLGWGYGTPKETNRQFKYLLETGNTGLTLFRDMPTIIGIDPDHPMALGEVGREGVSICTIQDMEEIFDGIPLEKVSTVLLAASTVSPIILSFYIALAEKRLIDPARLRGTISNDPIHGYFCYFQKSNPINLCLKVAGDVIEYCTKRMPLWHATYINSYDLRDSGINAPQEIAFALAIAIAYINEALERGLKIDDFAPRSSFYCNAGIDIFEEVAKLRAMRRMWAKLIKERYGAKDKRSLQFRFGVHTSGSSLVRQQPLNNIIRIAYEQLVAVLGGAQSVNSCTFLEPICLPTDFSQQTTLRTQQILAYETGVSLVADPLGGSYYIEYLTNRIEEEANKILKQIEDMGGIEKSIGWIENEIEKAAVEYQKSIENRERLIVGQNIFTIPPEEEVSPPGGVLKISPASEEAQITKVKRIKEERDNEKVKSAIKALGGKAERSMVHKKENLLPEIIEAAKCYATLEEIHGTIRMAYGYDWDPWGMRKTPF